jgi:Leucine-rich repeat (LRR) protein
MSRHIVFLFILLIAIGCKKDEPAEPAKVAVSDAPKADGTQPKKEEPKKKEEKKKEPKQAKLETLDLRSHGLFAAIDVPPGTKIGKGFTGLVFIAPNGEGMELEETAADLAKTKEEWSKSADFKVKSFLVEEPDALLAEIETGGKKQLIFRANAKIGDRPFLLKSFFNENLPEQEARRALAWARTFRQTPELKKALQQQDAAIAELTRAGAVFKGTNEVELPTADEKTFELLLAIPTLKSVAIQQMARGVSGFNSLGDLPGLHKLSLTGPWVDSTIINRLGNFSTLRSLQVNDAPITDSALSPIARLQDLEELDLSRTRITGSGLRNVTSLKKLRSLKLNSTDTNDKAMVFLKDLPELANLALADTAITDAAMTELAGLPSLALLDLTETLVGDASVAALLKMSALQHVEVFGTAISAAGVAKLKAGNAKLQFANWPQEEPAPPAVAPPIPIDKLPPADPASMVAKYNGKLTRDEDAAGKPITAIDLSNSKVTDADLGHLRELKSLHTLNLAGCAEIGDPGLPYLSGLTALEELNLTGTKVKGDGLISLKGLTKLTKLLLPEKTMLTGPLLTALAALPDLEKLNCVIGEPSHPRLAAIARMTSLKQLDLSGVTLTNRKLAYLKNLTALESLKLGSDGELTDRGLENLKGLPALQNLSIPNFRGTNAGLANLRGLSNLKTLKLWGPQITDLGNLSSLGQLERVTLDGLNIKDGALAAFRGCEKLHDIFAADTPLTDKAFDQLAEVKNLEFADLSRTKVTDAGLAKLNGLEELRGLRLEGTAIDGTGFAALRELPRLNRLLLAGSKVNDAGLAAIARLPRLRILDLSKTAVTNAGLSPLKQGRQFEELTLADCPQITDEAIATLKTLPALKRVVLTGTKVSPAAAEELRKTGVEVVAVGKP